MIWDHKIKLLLGQPLDLISCASGLPVDSFPSLKNAPLLAGPKVIRPKLTVVAENMWAGVIKQVLPITEYDEAILQCVVDVEASQSFCSNFEGYSLVFRFAPEVDDYFTDECLNLRYSRKNSDGHITSESDSISWHPGCDPARRVMTTDTQSNEHSRLSSGALHYLSTSIFHLFMNPRSDPNFESYLCDGSLGNFVVEYVIQQQYLQVRSLFDAICRVQQSRTYIDEKTPVSASPKA